MQNMVLLEESEPNTIYIALTAPTNERLLEFVSRFRCIHPKSIGPLLQEGWKVGRDPEFDIP